MSFKENYSSTSLCNAALAMVSESKTISSLEDPGRNAEACRRWYKPTVAKLLETHHWGLATKHAPLVEVTNGRTAEWNMAFAKPDDLAFPVLIGMASGASNLTYYQGLQGLIASWNNRPVFQMHNGVIYSNIGGDLEYVSYDITEDDFNATFADIVVVSLASRLALEIPKDYDLHKALAEDATAQINMAITQNLNLGRPTYGNNVPERDIARGSSLTGWDYIRRGLPQ